MRWPTTFTAAFGVRHAIVQAPMAGVATPELAAAVSSSGGLGSLGTPAMSPEAITAAIDDVRRRTSAPFNVNLFVLDRPVVDDAAVRRSIELTRTFRAALGLPEAKPPTRFAESFDAQLEATLAAHPPVVSFTFGIVRRDVVASFHAVGTRVIGTATTVAEARAWEAVGADAVVAQGAEAGGHRGTFLAPVEASLVGTLALVPQIVDAVGIPVVAAGGIADGRGVAACLALGAAACQVGTAFLVCRESSASPVWKKAVLEARDDATRVTRAVTGRSARMIANPLVEALDPHAAELPAYPVQQALTQEMRAIAGRMGRADLLSMYAGQAASLVRERGASEVLASLVEGAESVLARLAGP